MIKSKSTTCFKFGVKQCLFADAINHVSEALLSNYYIRDLFAGKCMMGLSGNL